MRSYVWLHNGNPLDVNVGNVRPVPDGSGTFVIESATVLNEGTYQCRAETQYGTAVSNTSLLQRAVLRTDVSTQVTNRTVTAGQPFHIRVEPLRCFPPPSFSWVVGRVIDSEHAPASRQLQTGRRLQISETG